MPFIKFWGVILIILGCQQTYALTNNDLLPPEQAFKFYAQSLDNKTIEVHWQIAEGYYLYREKVTLTTANTKNVTLGPYSLPHGTPKLDEAFGAVEIFHNALSFSIPVEHSIDPPVPFELKAGFQGCAEVGVCYPPMSKTIVIEPSHIKPSAAQTPIAPKTNNYSEQDQIAQNLSEKSYGLILASFFGFGLLLAFTPCIFPMIPILSGIIVGQKGPVTAWRGFILSLSYVIAGAVAYTAFGILAALFGSNLQAELQQPWIIASFSGLFILLSLSMFGFYNLELPQSLQNRLYNASNQQKNKGIISAAIMGALSALVVGPCVAAPLAGALIYIGQTGDVLLGGSALFLMGLGMGMPLLAIGASAGSLLPKTGAWLNTTKAIFGVVMLAVAAWMLDRILPASLMMALWASLLIIPAIYMNAIEPLPQPSNGWKKLWKGIGLIMLVYGIILIIGIATGSTNPLQPLNHFSQTTKASEHSLKFERITSLDDLNQKLSQAQQQQQWVMLDFYADWCISCKEMEAYTFSNNAVQQELSPFMLLQADVTAMTADDHVLLKHFNLIGPPAILFFDSGKKEQEHLRLIGYKAADDFLSHVKQAR
ncbi:MAG TPA: protein-disulfide reductase DsbD [Methylococcales bacterium]|nr:protein-disulfide reductase DsbD [Methylococcales bacterium]HIO13515.1 protein-disulfide reductase DsbD [Methylococcales bacterium]